MTREHDTNCIAEEFQLPQPPVWQLLKGSSAWMIPSSSSSTTMNRTAEPSENLRRDEAAVYLSWRRTT